MRVAYRPAAPTVPGMTDYAFVHLAAPAFGATLRRYGLTWADAYSHTEPDETGIFAFTLGDEVYLCARGV